jgi:tetratricopeptide (TPR) repeat protein
VLQDLGDLPAARAAFERALTIDEAAFSSDHPKVAARLNNLGMILQAQGDLPAAQALFERALDIYTKSLPPEHPRLAEVRSNLDQVISEIKAQS